MARTEKKAASPTSGSLPALSKRYSSIAEIKRDLFPNAAAEDAATAASEHGYENLMDEYFGPRQSAKA